MIGVNLDNLDKVIKINNLNYDSLDGNFKQLISSMNDLSNCYSGTSINFVFSEPIRQVDNVKKIKSIVKNYSDVLTDVKISYEKQDEQFQALFKNSNSN